jgi:hypothetical protein
MSAPFANGRPMVELPGPNRLLSDFASDLGAALAKHEIFVRGEDVVSINDAGDGLTRLSSEKLRSWLEQFACCYRTQSTGQAGQVIQIQRTMSNGDAVGVLASPQFLQKLRPIERFNTVRLPTLRPCGTLDLLEPGYDPTAKTFTAWNAPVIMSVDLDSAVKIITELLAEFPFADKERSRAVVVAAMLTVFAAGALPPKSLRPCFIGTANAEGSGKTLAVKCATVPVLGFVPSASKPRDEDELKKILLTAIMESAPVVFFDNYKGHLSSESLEAFLTSQDWGGRVLGASRSFRGQNNSTVFITGNGCTVSPDMRRRSLFFELFTDAERAEDRVFQNDLEVRVLLERRIEILSALWALLREGSEYSPSRTHSSFPEWSRIVGGSVERAGFGCPIETPQIEAAADTDGADMRELVSAIADCSSLKAVPFDELVETARQNGLFGRMIVDGVPLERKDKAALASLLKRYDRRLIGKFRFSLIGKGHSRKFQVEKVTV